MGKSTKQKSGEIEELIVILKKLEEQGKNIETIIEDSGKEGSTYKFTKAQKQILKNLRNTTYVAIQTRKTAADRLLEIIEVLEQNIPGISARLPKASFRLGEIEEIQEVVKKENLPQNRKINISTLVTKAKRQSIGLEVDRCISIENILKLKEYGLLTDEQIEKYRKRESEKVNGKAKSKITELIEILHILEDNGVDVSKLPKYSKKISELEALIEIAERENINPNYNIGLAISRALTLSKKKLSGENAKAVISENEIAELRRYGILTDAMIERYQKKKTGVQQLIDILTKLKNRGIDINCLTKYDDKIGEIEDIEGLQQIVEEENIPRNYRVGKAIRGALNAAKNKIATQENQKNDKDKKKTMKISDEEIGIFKEWGFITDESIEKFKKTRERNQGKALAKQTVDKVKEGDCKKIEELLRRAVAMQVGSNEEFRRELEALLMEEQSIDIG